MRLLMTGLMYALSFGGFLGGLWLGYWLEINLLGSTPEDPRVWPALIIAFIGSMLGRELGVRLRARVLQESP